MFGDNLRKILDEKGVSQTKFAKKLNTNNSTVTRWVSNNGEPTSYFVCKICEVLHVTPNDLFGYTKQTLAEYSTDELLTEIKRRTRI